MHLMTRVYSHSLELTTVFTSRCDSQNILFLARNSLNTVCVKELIKCIPLIPPVTIVTVMKYIFITKF